MDLSEVRQALLAVAMQHSVSALEDDCGPVTVAAHAALASPSSVEIVSWWMELGEPAYGGEDADVFLRAAIADHLTMDALEQRRRQL